MNKDELQARLTAQRKWREGRPLRPIASREAGRRPPFAGTVLLMVAVLGAMYAAWVLPPISDTAETDTVPSPEIAIASRAANDTAAAPGTIFMTVCAGGFSTAKLHVRFEPALNGDVRGYLNEGETVTAPIGGQGEPITKTMDGVSWTFIQLPITGWVSSSHLCK